ncbi:MAG: flagellar export protein FliJ [Caulobacter sp.]|jgi:flagellar FliJ protein|nr:flagellar export protein FliJ [Caulobacter sp.]
MKAVGSLIRISTYEVEDLQKRLAGIVDRRTQVEMRMAVLEAEAEMEIANARADAEAGWYLVGFREGVKQRRAALQDQVDALGREEEGARDALNEAFEALKKYEQVAESAANAARRETARRETAALDELGLRRAAAR